MTYHTLKSQSKLSGDTFSIEAPQNLLRTKYSKNISSGKGFPFKVAANFLEHSFCAL